MYIKLFNLINILSSFWTEWRRPR